MNKAEMADKLAARTGLGNVAARDAVDSVFAIIGETLAGGEEVRIAGFGAFGTGSRPAHTGRNPRTGEAVAIPAWTSPTFKAGKTLRDTVNGGCKVMSVTRSTATRDATNRLDIDSSRLLCDDGRSASCRAGAGKSQGSSGVDGWTATGLDVASRMRQGDRAKGSSWWRTQACAGGQGCRGLTNATKRRANEVSPTSKTSFTVWRAFICLAPIGSLIATVFGPPSTTTMS